MSLPTDPKERKNLPIGTGVLDYFPSALAEIARVSKVGNDQHNPGQPLHWDKSKSQDEYDAMIRHSLERYKKDTDGTYHAAKMAWRALAFLERLIEEDRKKPMYNAKENPTSDLAVYNRCLSNYSGAINSQFQLRDSKLVRPEVLGKEDGQWQTVPTDQADGCASDAPTRNEASPHQRRFRFNGDGDRNG